MFPPKRRQGRRDGIDRRRVDLTIHFPERRAGAPRRAALDRRSTIVPRREGGTERRIDRISNR